MFKMSHLKSKQQELFTYFFESVTLTKYPEISVPTPTISVSQPLPRSPTSPHPHNINIPIPATGPYSLKILITPISIPKTKPPPPHNIYIPNLYPRPPTILTSPMSVPKLILYADDANIIVTANTIEEVYNQIVSLIDNLEDWVHCNSLTLNLKKTKYLIFSMSKVALPCPLDISQTPIERKT